MKLKVMTILGTRPEIIKLSRIIHQLDKDFHHILVHTGQNYAHELNEIFVQEMQIKKPDYTLSVGSDRLADTIGKIISESDKIMETENPDALFVLGDTNSCLSVIPAKRRKIPIFHMEAGNRCFDARVPEEINRKIVDHTSDINLTYSEFARGNLLREGLPADRIIKVGSPMREVLNFYAGKIDPSSILEKLKLTAEKFFLVSCHREENVDSPTQLQRFIEILNKIVHEFHLPVLVTTHPRTRKRIEQQNFKLDPSIQLLKPFGFFDYVKLQQSAKATLSDSGTITEEASLLNFPVLNLRESFERQEGMDEAAVMLTGLDCSRVIQGIRNLESRSRGTQRELPIVGDYLPDNVSIKISRIIFSYINFINEKVWMKNRS